MSRSPLPRRYEITYQEYNDHPSSLLETFLRLHMIRHHRFVSLFLEIRLIAPEKLEIKARTSISGDIGNSSTAAAGAEYCTLKLLAVIFSAPGCARYVPELVALFVIMTINAPVNEARPP